MANPGLPGSEYSAQTETLTAGTSSLKLDLTKYPCIFLFRCPSTNTDSCFFDLGGFTATSGAIEVQPGEAVPLDISQMMMLKQMVLGRNLTAEDFPKTLTYISTGAGQTFKVDVFSL